MTKKYDLANKPPMAPALMTVGVIEYADVNPLLCGAIRATREYGEDGKPTGKELGSSVAVLVMGDTWTIKLPGISVEEVEELISEGDFVVFDDLQVTSVWLKDRKLQMSMKASAVRKAE